MATQCSKKGSEKVLGRVLGKGSLLKGSEKGACCGFCSTRAGSEKGSEKVHTLFSEPPKRGQKKWCLAKIVEKCRKTF